MSFPTLYYINMYICLLCKNFYLDLLLSLNNIVSILLHSQRNNPVFFNGFSMVSQCVAMS